MLSLQVSDIRRFSLILMNFPFEYTICISNEKLEKLSWGLSDKKLLFSSIND
jgi:hypothetical protein